MPVSLEWLNEYVDITDSDPEQIAHELTMSGLEVEETEQIGSDFTNIVAAKILEINPHPQADKLQAAKVFDGKEEKVVVCGARNIVPGQIVPYATTGSQVLDKAGEKFTLKPAVIRGMESQGMLCSAEELGLKTSDFQEDEGILILNRFKKDLKPGQDIKDVLGIKEDTVLHTAPTANRGDEMSLLGIAREISAIFNKPLKYPELKSYDDERSDDFKIEIKDPDTCKYYAAGTIKNVKIKPSPDWMKRRLSASGIRSINNVVDITNYVMLEYGQPLHAFDADKLGENYLSVRRARPGEKMITLDDTERNLTTDSVLIAASKEIVGLAGLMGGFNSEIDENTKNIVLESAYFFPQTTRKSARSIGLRTEASARFERGVDIGSVKPALFRAMQLMEEHADAEICGISETGENKLPDIEITLRFAQIKRILGTEIPESKCIEILDNLGFKVQGRNTFSAKFKVPEYRINDVTREIDLIEEISRIYGYDKIETTLPGNMQAAEISEENKIIEKIQDIFTGKGFREIITSSLIGKPLLDKFGIDYNESEAVQVTNPQSDEHSMLRQDLFPSVLWVVKHNFDMGQKNLRVYEIGKTFHYKGGTDEKNTGTEEKRIIAGAISGDIGAGFRKDKQEDDFYTLKGVVENLLSKLKLGSRTEFETLENCSLLHPGRSVQIKLLGKTPTVAGILGQLHPELAEKCKFNQPVYFFEIDLELLLKSLSYALPKFKPLPQFPAAARDIAFIIPENIACFDITKKIKKASSGGLFKKSDVFDLYKGEHVPEGSKSMAFRITLQDKEATLTDEKIDTEIQKIRDGLKKAYPEISFRE